MILIPIDPLKICEHEFAVLYRDNQPINLWYYGGMIGNLVHLLHATENITCNLLPKFVEAINHDTMNNNIKMDQTITPGHLLIAEERMEQLTKHGRTLELDKRFNKKELLRASMFCMTLNDTHWPADFSEKIRDHIKTKTYVERLAISGAFIAAEMDRQRGIEPKFYSLR